MHFSMCLLHFEHRHVRIAEHSFVMALEISYQKIQDSCEIKFVGAVIFILCERKL